MFDVIGTAAWAVVAVANCAVAASLPGKTWNVDEETRKMVAFETGKDLVVPAESVNRGPADRVYYGEGTRERMMAHLKETGHRTTWVENGVLYLDGRPSLRCGLYAIGYCTSRPHLKRLTETDNPGCDFEWSQVGLEFGRLVLGSEAREGVKAQKPSQEVFDRIARVIEENRERDFGYYYLCDEPECRGISPVYLRYLYQFVKERDPYHVVLICSRAADRYISCCDWIEVHPYLAPRYNARGEREFGTELHTFGNYVEGVVSMNRPDKVIGCTPTAFGYLEVSYDHDLPTFDEFVASVWAILLEGGRSIFPFLGNGLAKSHDIYEGVRYVFSSAKALQDYLLFGLRTRVEKNDRWAATQWSLKDEKMVAVVNFSSEPQSVDLAGVEGVFREFRGTRTFTWPSALVLRPYEVVVATTRCHDKDLPTLTDVRTKLSELNGARKRRDNQILGRARELGFAGSKALGNQQCICNGMLEDQAELFRGGDAWYEIGFPMGHIDFDRILLHGENLDKTTVRILTDDGKWIALQTAKRTVEPYLVAFALPRLHSAIKVRFEFHKDRATLYEIEFPRAKGGRPLPSLEDWVRRSNVSRHLSGQHCLVFDAANADVKTNGWSGSKWYGREDLVLQKPSDGSFVLGPSAATHALAFDPKWKWIDFELPREAEKTTERGYSRWDLLLLNHPSRQGILCGNVRSSQPGLYTIPLKPIPDVTHGYVQVRAQNMHVPFGYIRFSEEPPTRFSVEPSSTNGVIRVGDCLRFRLVLENPCTGVTLSFNVDRVAPRPFAINGASSFELAQEDEQGKVWSGVLEVKHLSTGGKGVYAKVLCLGGLRPLTVLTVIPGSFEM